MNKKRAVIAGIVIIAAVAWFGGKAWLNSKAAKEVDSAIVKMEDQTGVKATYKSVDISPFTSDGTLFDITLTTPQNETTTVEKAILTNFDRKNEIPAHATLKLIGVKTGGDNAEVNEKLKELGYKKLPLADVIGSYTYDHQKKALNVEELGGQMKGIGSYVFKAQFGNLLLDKENINSGAFLFSSMAITVKQASWTFIDDGLMTRLFNAEAKKQNISVEDLKEKLKNDTAQNMAMLGDSPQVRDLTIAVQAFINNPQRITILIRPKQPVSVGQLIQLGNNPAEIFSTLGIQVKP
ncbi:hypothetical protein JWG39_05540 [Desulforhopalus vacuolatus]|uniref:hypothetical protein n=1 Tax=Desulforhopalus vacuolatus TaxID=40414 RepID=UPI00196308CB|nr:hypothetical protein [Desulforhopalus vacuolatus]MBM9519284.1 hypothetical protein [Desulforhopalus vacuolatus]